MNKVIKIKYGFISGCSLLIAFFSIIACAQKGNEARQDTVASMDTVVKNARIIDSFPAGKIIQKVVCLLDSTQSYALYKPPQYEFFEMPVCFFFDPHANGVLPLSKYKSLADKYNFILIGSNNSKNGNDWQMAENIFILLLNDVKQRINFDSNRIYSVGFSGGAKVASNIALHHNEVKGVIASGAALPDGTPAADFNFSFTAIAGEGDMNMTDLVAINNDFDKTQTRHRIISFPGKHEWPPETAMDIALAGLQLDAMSKKDIPVNDDFINKFISQSKKVVGDDINANKLLPAVDICNLSINMLLGLYGSDWFIDKKDSLLNNQLYKKQKQQQQEIFVKEQQQKSFFIKQFQQGDLAYWTSTINELSIKAKQQNVEAAMNQRLLAYLSLAFYSISNNLITNNQNEEAKYFVTLYKKADPTNSEAWYFSAILNARNNDAKSVEADLEKAVSNGFNDTMRMRTQPEFKNIYNKIDFNKIEKNMSKPKE